MTERVRLKRLIAAAGALVLESVDEERDGLLGGIPSSYLWIAIQRLGFNLDQYHDMLGMLRSQKAVIVSNHLVMPGARLRHCLERLQWIAKHGTEPPSKSRKKEPLAPGCCCADCLPGQLHLDLEEQCKK